MAKKMKSKIPKRRRRPGEQPSGANPQASRAALNEDVDFPFPHWMENDGMHLMHPKPLDDAALERMTKEYQRNIRNSPLWYDMVSQFGLEKANEMLLEFRVERR